MRGDQQVWVYWVVRGVERRTTYGRLDEYERGGDGGE